MNKNYVKPIAKYLSYLEPIGEITFHFGPKLTSDCTFNKNNIEASVSLKINGYYIYAKNTLFVEIPLDGFHYANDDVSKEIKSRAINFEKEFNAIKASGKMKNQIAVTMAMNPDEKTFLEIFDDVWNIRIFTRNVSNKEVKFIAFETDNFESVASQNGPGRLIGSNIIIRTPIEEIFNDSSTYVNQKENEKNWTAVKKDNDRISSCVDEETTYSNESSLNLYRYPAVINNGQKEKHKHWPYPADDNLKEDHFVDEAYFCLHPFAVKKERRLSIKAKFLNWYADRELARSLANNEFDERVGYPAHLIKKYQEQIDKHYEGKKQKEIEKVEEDRVADLTEDERKIFNPDILTFRTGAGKVVSGKYPLIPTVINEEIDKLRNKFEYLKICNEHGIKENRTENLHMCFLGNPGTGKTTVAREITQMFYDLGYIKYNECVEVNAQNIKGGYVGQTGTITRAIIKHAKGRVLFIDEAYALYDDYENGYGKEAVAVLLKEMEDNRNDFIVIFAGYNKEMQKFLEMNEGLRSRINRYIEFPDFTKKELCSIFIRQLANRGMRCDEVALRKFFDKVDAIKSVKNFSNARCVRNIVEKIIEEHAYNYMSNHVGKKYVITEADLTDEIFDEIINMSR